MTQHQPIAVIGAGLGGLTLASVLHRGGVDVAVYDLDASPTARAQGGMLDMHEGSGQAALRAAGLYEQFRSHVHVGGEAMRILDKDATVRMEETDEGDRNRPEINRRTLRDLLLGSLPAGTVRWGAKVTGVRTLDGGPHEVTFAGGDTVTTDLLVGADGAWSKVRPLVSSATPGYCGLSFVEISLHDADDRHPDAAGMVGGGILFALGDGKGFLGHRDPDGSLHVYAAMRVGPGWLSTIDFTDTEAAKAALAAQFADWSPRLRALVTDADGDLIPRQIHALPVGHHWARVPGVTLLGDAAHVMSPFAGEGANLAMQDGAELAAALLAHPEDVETALAEFEAAMFPRAAASAAESAKNLELCFRADAPQGLLDLFASFAELAS